MSFFVDLLAFLVSLLPFRRSYEGDIIDTAQLARALKASGYSATFRQRPIRRSKKYKRSHSKLIAVPLEKNQRQSVAV